MNIMGTDVLEKKKKQTTLDVGNKKIGFALIIEEKEDAHQEENLTTLIKEAQKVGADLYKKGLISPCDPIR